MKRPSWPPRGPWSAWRIWGVLVIAWLLLCAVWLAFYSIRGGRYPWWDLAAWVVLAATLVGVIWILLRAIRAQETALKAQDNTIDQLVEQMGHLGEQIALLEPAARRDRINRAREHQATQWWLS